ncbi:hypothetical protein FHR32_006237 [Streptosporangium album]|uniref:Uncharacterized protein n=1 Tax=Streptosporangium album TaxID=47479 RepID=A0A7W7WC94_9ACTN|nr:hypothetical protein [Streptosporangium album]
MSHPALISHVEQWVSGPDDTFPSPDPASVCLAVLTSFFLLLMGAASRRARRIPEARAAGASPTLLVARPPQQSTALRLARLSVLRI